MPLVTDEKTAEVFVSFDVHNLVRRAEEAPGPTSRFCNQHKYPTGYLYIALTKVYAALKHYGLNECKRTCLVLSAQENSQRRRDVYPEYKAGRAHREYSVLELTNAYGKLEERSPDPVGDFMDLIMCLPCINIIMKKPWETDDALASFTHKTKKINPKAKYVIVSNDRDLWGMMADNVICTSKPKEEFSIANLKKDYLITNPKLLPLSKALFGDGSDKLKKAVARVTEENVAKSLPDGFLDLVKPRKGEKLSVSLASMLAKNHKLVKGTSLEACIGKEAEIQTMIDIIRLRKNLDLLLVKTKPNLKKMQTLLKWYELKSQYQPSEVMMSLYKP